MAGHSKWANIKHKKAATDAKRGKVFTRLIKEITVAARLGGGEMSMNPRLRLAVDKAMGNNMPKDTIERAIKRGSGELEGVNYEEIRYEGYGIGGAAVIVDCMTDNRTRTVADVRHAFSKYGGNLGTDGSVAFLFKHCGQILFAPGTDENKLLEAALEAGALDVIASDDGSLEVVTGPYDFISVKDGRRSRENAKVARRNRIARRRPGRLHHRGHRRVEQGCCCARILQRRRPCAAFSESIPDCVSPGLASSPSPAAH